MFSNPLIRALMAFGIMVAIGSPSSYGQSICCSAEDHPIMLEFMYVGQDCSTSQTGQRDYRCSDLHVDAALPGEVWAKICATEQHNNPLQVWKRTKVNLGSSFYFTQDDAGSTSIPDDTHIFLFADESENNLLQHIKVQSSCQAPLTLNDQWGALKLTAIEGALGGLCNTENVALLPLSFVYFNVSQKENLVDINWGVSGELFEGKMEVQRSANGRYFNPIATFSASGVSGVSEYNYVDLLPHQASNYYRLKIFNADGSASFSQIEQVDFSTDDEGLVFPNPMVDELSILGLTEDQDVVVVNVFGEVMTNVKQLGLGSQLDVSALTEGMYYVIIQGEGSTNVYPVVKQ